MPAPGRLYYAVGPSGVGKDTVIAEALAMLPPHAPVRIARRTITRPAAAPGASEVHEPVTRREWDELQRAGGFALHWEANGLAYGVRRELDDWLAAGVRVIVNGSREHLPLARARYPDLLVLAFSAPPGRVMERLLARGRESRGEIEARLARSATLDLPTGPGTHTIVNDGPVSEAAARLAAILAGD